MTDLSPLKTLFVQLLLLFVALPGAAFAQNDSIFYRSAFEENVFQQALQGEVNDLLVLTVMGGDSADFIEIRNSLNSFYTYLTPQLTKKDANENARIIFREVKKTFLTNYVDTAYFTSVFRNSFNCVSGTALFAVVLDHYQIPYEIRELPTHVYLVAYPHATPLTFESTSQNGFAPDLKTKTLMVNGLVAEGLINQQHLDEVGVEKAYNEYFYPKAVISLRNLAGLQYHNSASLMRSRKAFRAGLSELRKSDILYPVKRNSFFKLDFLEHILDRTPITDIETFQYVIEYTNLSHSEKNNQTADEAFEGFLKNMLLKNGNEALAKQVYNNMMLGLKDETLKRTITTTFNTAYAYYYLVKSQYDQSLKFATQAWEGNKNNLVVQGFIVSAILGKGTTAAASPATIKRLNDAAIKYPFFRTNADVRLQYAQCYANLCYINFRADHEKEGLYYQNLMQKEIFDAGNSIDPPVVLIGYTYAEAGAYYYRKNDYKKALEIMNLGLRYSPGHPEILERIKIVKEAMQ